MPDAKILRSAAGVPKEDGRRIIPRRPVLRKCIRNCRRQGIATELLECTVSSLAAEGINKVALLVFNRNEAGNAFWEKNGFTSREDLVYRNKALVEMVRIDT